MSIRIRSKEALFREERDTNRTTGGQAGLLRGTVSAAVMGLLAASVGSAAAQEKPETLDIGVTTYSSGAPSVSGVPVRQTAEMLAGSTSAAAIMDDSWQLILGATLIAIICGRPAAWCRYGPADPTGPASRPDAARIHGRRGARMKDVNQGAPLVDEPTSGVASADKFGVMERLMKALRQAQVVRSSSNTTWRWCAFTPPVWPSGRRGSSK